MDNVEAIRLAILELGATSNEELAAFAQERHGITIEPKYVPIARAMLKQRQLQAQFREKQAAEGDRTAPTAG